MLDTMTTGRILSDTGWAIFAVLIVAPSIAKLFNYAPRWLPIWLLSAVGLFAALLMLAGELVQTQWTSSIISAVFVSMFCYLLYLDVRRMVRNRELDAWFDEAMAAILEPPPLPETPPASLEP
jgi:hypothetical protein